MPIAGATVRAYRNTGVFGSFVQFATGTTDSDGMFWASISQTGFNNYRYDVSYTTSYGANCSVSITHNIVINTPPYGSQLCGDYRIPTDAVLCCHRVSVHSEPDVTLPGTTQSPGLSYIEANLSDCTVFPYVYRNITGSRTNSLVECKDATASCLNNVDVTLGALDYSPTHFVDLCVQGSSTYPFGPCNLDTDWKGLTPKTLYVDLTFQVFPFDGTSPYDASFVGELDFVSGAQSILWKSAIRGITSPSWTCPAPIGTRSFFAEQLTLQKISCTDLYWAYLRWYDDPAIQGSFENWTNGYPPCGTQGTYVGAFVDKQFYHGNPFALSAPVAISYSHTGSTQTTDVNFTITIND